MPTVVSRHAQRLRLQSPRQANFIKFRPAAEALDGHVDHSSHAGRLIDALL